jgi:hypothetical protein
MWRGYDWVLIVSSVTQHPTSLFFPLPAPLFEEKRHALTLTSIAQLFGPPRFH